MVNIHTHKHLRDLRTLNSPCQVKIIVTMGLIGCFLLRLGRPWLLLRSKQSRPSHTVFWNKTLQFRDDLLRWSFTLISLFNISLGNSFELHQVTTKVHHHWPVYCDHPATSHQCVPQLFSHSTLFFMCGLLGFLLVSSVNHAFPKN